MNSFTGAGVALVTPFNEDLTVDYNSLEKLIEHQISGGMDYLVSLGTTGESATLRVDEKQKIWSFTAEVVKGRVPLMAGIGGNDTAAILESFKKADLSGYSAILSVSPYYNKPTQEGIYRHYKALAEASPLPLVLYNVPGRTGSNLAVETTVRLAKEFPNIIAIKEASGNFDQFNRILRNKPEDFKLISGDDPVILPMMALGAIGVISVIGNAYPSLVSKLTRLCQENNFPAARAIHSSLLEVTRLCFVEGNPAGVKVLLNELGITAPYVRLPLTEVSEPTKMALLEQMKYLEKVSQA